MRRLQGTLAVLIGLWLSSAASPAWARHHGHSGDAVPGGFDYYLLSLSWSPAYCLEAPGAAECNGTRRYGFIVHGLWPQNERGWPEHCNARAPVPDDVVQGIADLMPARGLVYHEWSTHGTCSGLAPAAFFALVRRAYATLSVPPPLVRPNDAFDAAPAAITDAFLKANPHFPAASFAVTCTGQTNPRLREVHVCFDRELAPRACSADVLRSACRAERVIIPPIR